MSYHKSLKNKNFVDNFFNALDLELPDSEEIPPFNEWVKDIKVDGKQFSYINREYLLDVYKDNHSFKILMKCTQTGGTVEAILRAIYCSRYKNYRNILYYFPSRTDVTEFSKGRVSPLIEENPDSIGSWLRDTDAANIKRIWNSFLYLLGMRSALSVKNIPADYLIFDESDEASPEAREKAMERLGASDEGHIFMLSNPTLPDYGIDLEFKESDQRYWLLKCNKCNHYNCLEDAFLLWAESKGPAPLVDNGNGGDRLCEKCRSILNPSVGQWVAKKPSIKDKRGYHYTQLWSKTKQHNPKTILKKFRTATSITTFYNLIIGIGYVEAQNRLSIEEVLALCGSEGIASSDLGPCFMGVDQGKDLHVVIGKRHPVKSGKIIHLNVYKDWEELDGLMKNFNVVRCVVDSEPELRNARAFANRHKGKIFLNKYNIHQRDSYKWDEEELRVSGNRTETLDASHREIQEQSIILPKKCEIVQEFAKHLHNLAKKLEEDEETGSKRYVYIPVGTKEDHFRHAFNYEVMARQYGRSSVFADSDMG